MPYLYATENMYTISAFRISFTTPPDRCAALAAEAKALYSQFLEVPNNNSDRINRMDRINSTTNPVNPVHPVQTDASFSTAPDSQKNS